MSFRRKGKSKSKSKSITAGDGRESVFAATIPASAFAAVPRVVTTAATGTTRTQTLLPFSSLPLPDNANDDTDSSLADYQLAKSTSSFPTDIGRNNRSGGRLNPPAAFADDDDSIGTPDLSAFQQTYDSQGSAFYQESYPDSAFQSEKPSKGRRRTNSAGPSDETRRKKPAGKGKGTKRKSQSLERQPEAAVNEDQVVQVDVNEAQLFAIPKTYTVPLYEALNSGDVDPGVSQLKLLDTQIEKADDKKQQLESKLLQLSNEHDKIQQELLEASLRPDDELTTQDLSSTMRRSLSITEEMKRKRNEYNRALEEKIAALEEQRQEMLKINRQQAVKLASALQQLQQRQPITASDSELVRQVQELRDEADVLKSVVHRLNQELSRYQTKFRTLTDSEIESLPGLPLRGPKPSWLVNTKYLSPLIIAYDDLMKQKNDVILQHEIELEHFRKELDEILKENRRLHIRIEQSDALGEPVGLTEWRQLQEQCKLVLEENEILMQQLEVQEDKFNQRHKADVQEVLTLTQRTNLAESESSLAKREVDELRNKYSELRRQYDQMVTDMLNKIPVEEHINAMAALKQSQQDEKRESSKQLAELSTKLQSAELERDNLSREIEKLNIFVKQLENEIKQRDKNQRKYQKNVELMQSAMDKLQMKELTIEQYLDSVVKTAAKVAQERDGLVQSIDELDKDKKKAWKKVIAENMKRSQIREKMLSVRHKAESRVEEIMTRMKEQEIETVKLKEAYDSEIRHLRQLIREKDDHVTMLEREKKDLIDDLETMWQSASKSNRHMWDTIRHTDHKLQQHLGLFNRIPESDPMSMSDV